MKKESDSSSSFKKYASLLVLVIQNTALVLTLHYSRTGSEGEPLYIASTVVVLTELLKFVISFGILCYVNEMNVLKAYKLLEVELFDKPGETLILLVPSILYTIQNNLLILALTNLDAATFQVTYQLKILTTALFSVIMLGKKLNSLKWISLVILMFAVALVQWPTSNNEVVESDLETGQRSASPFIGVCAILLACLSSGFSGVYIEKILKRSKSMWIRNTQLGGPNEFLFVFLILSALMSIFVGLFGIFVTDWDSVMDHGFFHGYSPVVLTVVALQAVGGLIVAVVMKYADNILKGFATSVSIVLSSLFSYFFASDFHPTWFFVMGATFVLMATFLYSKPESVLSLPVIKTKAKLNR